MATRNISRARRPGGNKGTGAVRQESHNNRSKPDFDRVQLRIHEIECVKTTREIDRDEITIAAIKVEGSLQTSGGKKKLKARAEKGVMLDGGKFKKGDTREFNNPRTVLSFAAGDSDAGWSRYYYATLLMIEKDQGALGDAVNSAIKSVEDEVTRAVEKAAGAAATAVVSGLAAGAAAGSAIPVPLIGTAVGAAAGTAVGLVCGQIKKARQDDVFDPREIHLRLDRFPDEAGQIAGSRDKAVFKGFQGHYVVTYSWAVS
jgi:hypothetical protein